MLFHASMGKTITSKKHGESMDSMGSETMEFHGIHRNPWKLSGPNFPVLGLRAGIVIFGYLCLMWMVLLSAGGRYTNDTWLLCYFEEFRYLGLLAYFPKLVYITVISAKSEHSKAYTNLQTLTVVYVFERISLERYICNVFIALPAPLLVK